MTSFIDALEKRILVFDGAMGTQIQNRQLTADDFGGKELEGCNEFLVKTRPDVIEAIHAAYFAAGSDIVETNSFGSNQVVLAEYGIADQAFELNRLAAVVAQKAAKKYSTKEKPRFVVGSIGPGTKLPTLGHTTFDVLLASYTEQARGLLEGGVDGFIIETCQDLLQAKSAVLAVQDALKAACKKLPIIVQVTLETTGTMLVGSEIAAALCALEPLGIDVIGMNCATGPEQMHEPIRYLCEHTGLAVSCQPNAGLPENVGGKAVYPLGPDAFAPKLCEFVNDWGVNLVGGCCGTTPEHIAKLSAAVAHLKPKKRTVEKIEAVSSIYTIQTLDQYPKPFIVGERTNANGSKKFRELLARDDWEGLTFMARAEEKEMAHALDVCAAYVGRDEGRDMQELLTRYTTQVTIPLMIDSTETPVMERALKMLGGRCLINSVNLEDGEKRLDLVAGLAKRYGAALVALTIDETGMAKTIERKVAVAKRIHDLCVQRHGLKSGDLIFDPLTFTLGSGDAEFREAGINTLEGIWQIKKTLPGVRTILGVSNISFGLNPDARHVLNSVFLHHAIESGLDCAIVNAAKIVPLHKIPADLQELARRLVFNERVDGEDPLTAFMAAFEGGVKDFGKKEKKDDAHLPVEERLKNRIVDGSRDQLEALLDQARVKHGPVGVINNVLLEGMKTVGELFGSGKMQLPFVLQSAEVMKAAVGLLEPFMEKTEGVNKGSIVLATVKGDVHDIGKNLVDIILSNNGFKVYNLGIKQPIDHILEKAVEHGVDAIGLSGLLVKSTVVMKEDLEEMNRRGVRMPVLLGGAALTRRYVEEDLKSLYEGEVFYGRDAFAGLHIMERLVTEKKKELTKKCPVEVVLYAGIGPNTKPLSFRAPYKVFFGRSVGDLFFNSLPELETVLAKYRGQYVSFHCEDPEILEKHKNEPTHELQRPPEAEISAIDFALELIQKYNLSGKICHVSTLEGLEKIIKAKKLGVNVTLEITPHHLYFDMEMLNEGNRKIFQMNPPLRRRVDRLKIIEFLKNGEIDYLATDHAPHTKEEKEKGISGLPHLDTYGPFTTWLMHEHNFTAEDIARVCSQNPANFLNNFISGKYGKIEEGYIGSLTILSMEKPIKITKNILKTKCGWSPFEGVVFPGRGVMTIIKGEVKKDER